VASTAGAHSAGAGGSRDFSLDGRVQTVLSFLFSLMISLRAVCAISLTIVVCALCVLCALSLTAVYAVMAVGAGGLYFARPAALSGGRIKGRFRWNQILSRVV
ncbi:MAG TPA: hypothetical protein VN971_07785, partial [Thermoanaerobaculia bacterium]|nr:hypothetical protein [Thermoanaerobaculia bacterium]